MPLQSPVSSEPDVVKTISPLKESCRRNGWGRTKRGSKIDRNVQEEKKY